jgi:hypothetical protein
VLRSSVISLFRHILLVVQQGSSCSPSSKFLPADIVWKHKLAVTANLCFKAHIFVQTAKSHCQFMLQGTRVFNDCGNKAAGGWFFYQEGNANEQHRLLSTAKEITMSFKCNTYLQGILCVLVTGLEAQPFSQRKPESSRYTMH